MDLIMTGQQQRPLLPLWNQDKMIISKKHALYLSYATSMTYVPVLTAEQFQLPCRVIYDGFPEEDEQTGSNWFLLSQNFNKNRKLLLLISSLLYRIMPNSRYPQVLRLIILCSLAVCSLVQCSLFQCSLVQIKFLCLLFN